MGKLIDEPLLRDKTWIFDSRKDAGKMLGRRLSHYASTDSIVLAVPAGGVPVAHEIAKYLKLPLDLIIVRKIQIPGNTEAGFGAVGPDGEAVFNEMLLSQLRLTERTIKEQVEKTKLSLEARNRKFRKGRPFPDLRDKTVIVVDDGLASGYTMYEAMRFLRKKGPEKIVIAVPTAPERTIEMLLPEADEIYCLNVRRAYHFAVAEAYRAWYDVGDEEVLSLLDENVL
ncbi:MAG: hypothetical protein A2X59_10185 [Nitrospirae bacterium GWC2_42_7]|nr:MAG: hypothetical protein A2X59_10185 [Nitrospirae bacterium GWC2_42_7]